MNTHEYEQYVEVVIELDRKLRFDKMKKWEEMIGSLSEETQIMHQTNCYVKKANLSTVISSVAVFR